METWNDFIASVRDNKAALLERYGGIDGLHRHMQEERPLLEKQGWKFATLEEVRARQAASHRPSKLSQRDSDGCLPVVKSAFAVSTVTG